MCGPERDYMVNRLTGKLEDWVILKISKTKGLKIGASMQHIALRIEAGCLNRKLGGLYSAQSGVSPGALPSAIPAPDPC